MSKIEAVRSPIRTYQHSHHENRVDLVGTVHIAEPAYYEAVQQFVDSRTGEGVVVHYEQTLVPTPEQLAEAPRAVRHKAERVIAAMSELYGMIGEIDGLVSQNGAITIRDGWENHDSTLLEQCATMSRFTIDGLQVSTKLAKLATRLIGQAEMQTILLQQISAISSGGEHRPGLVERLVTIGRDKHTVLGRNAVAFAAFDAELDANPTTDLLLLWGAEHLNGMDHEVKNRGFVQTDERYLTAIQAR